MKKYAPIDPQLFIDNRKKFIAQMQPGSIAIFFSNDEMPRNGDASFDFKQNSDIFYLTGMDQEDTILVLFPDSPVPAFREAIFTRRTNETIAVWDGHKYTKEEATATSGVKTIYWTDEFSNVIHPIINYAENIYLNLNENDRAGVNIPYKDLRMVNELKAKYPLHTFRRAAPIMQRLRSVKHPIEIELIKKAVSISDKAFRRMLRFVKPGVMEYEIEAELIHEYIRNAGNGHSFHPIIASGKNACTLHYIDNNSRCNDGELVLIDTGVDYANYASDITRTIPVNGRFTPRQKDVYNAVLRVMKEAKKLLRPGVLLMEYHAEVCKIMEGELIGLGLFTRQDVERQNPANPLFRKYYMHGTSHFLGIDVHDVGMRYEPMKPNMVFSCEPGIYIPEEGIGIRIENDVMITDGEVFDFMKDFPIEVDEIETLMNER